MGIRSGASNSSSLKFDLVFERKGKKRGVPVESTCSDKETKKEWCCFFSVDYRFCCSRVASFWRRHSSRRTRR
jgi:hypothetical protein